MQFVFSSSFRWKIIFKSNISKNDCSGIGGIPNESEKENNNVRCASICFIISLAFSIFSQFSETTICIRSAHPRPYHFSIISWTGRIGSGLMCSMRAMRLILLSSTNPSTHCLCAGVWYAECGRNQIQSQCTRAFLLSPNQRPATPSPNFT